jgi:hypothetical protein
MALAEAPLELRIEPAIESDDEALDAYSLAVSTAAERLIPSVASLRVTRQVGDWTAGGAGSAVAIEPVGHLVTSAHVVEGTDRGTATFVDGAELAFEVVGRDPLSDLAVVRTTGGTPRPAPLGHAERLQRGRQVADSRLEQQRDLACALAQQTRVLVVDVAADDQERGDRRQREHRECRRREKAPSLPRAGCFSAVANHVHGCHLLVCPNDR